MAQNILLEEVLVEAKKNGEGKLHLEGIYLMAENRNRNGRVYPKKILDAQVKKYIEESVNKNTAYGELSHPQCYTPEAKVFVENKGLILISDVKVGDFVYGDDKDGNTIISEVTKVINEYYEGDIYEFDSKHFKAKVTPNHRFYLKNRKNEYYTATAEELYNNLDKYSHDYIPKSMNWKPDNVEEYISFSKVKRNVIKGKAVEEDLVLNINDFCALTGIFLAEGHSKPSKNKSGDVYNIFYISQNLGDKYEEICNLLNKIGLKYDVRIKERKNIHATIAIREPRLAEYYSQFGDCYNKYIPSEILTSSKENIETFLYWFNLGDGSIQNTTCTLNSGVSKSYSYKDVFTVSEKLADGLAECILKIGSSTNKRIQLSAKDYLFDEHVIQIKNKSPLYRLTIGNSKGKFVDKRFLDVKVVSYKGNVVCLETETNNFFVEHFGSFHLTGNSMTINPDNISHRILSLTEDGNYWRGKSLVLDTPKGNIIKALVDGGGIVGMSTRGIGTLRESNGVKVVQEDFALKTIDCVLDPSCQVATMNAIMESTETFYCEDEGCYILAEEIKKEINKTSKANLEKKMLESWKKYVKYLNL
jgi:hypothetical protein